MINNAQTVVLSLQHDYVTDHRSLGSVSYTTRSGPEPKITDLHAQMLISWNNIGGFSTTLHSFTDYFPEHSFKTECVLVERN